MSLYDGLEMGHSDRASANKGSVEGWSSGIKLLQSQIQLKKASLSQMKRDKGGKQQSGVTSGGSAPTVVTPVVDLTSRAKEKFDPVGLTLDAENNLFSKTRAQEGGGTMLFGELMVRDEYNPMFPNDYEEIMKKKDAERYMLRLEEKRRDAEEREKRKRERFERSSGIDDDYREKRDEVREKEKRIAGAAIAPPTNLIEADKQILEEPVSMPPPSPVNPKGLGVAAKIMERYGYRQGQGLGKLEQGMSTALTVEKVSKHGGKIIHERDVKSDSPQPPPITEVLRNPTKVVLIKNMVGPGEVDDELEPEIKAECAKYGDVINCVIFEIPDVSDDEAVRVFLEFAKIEQAIKAVVDLNGRYFGGRLLCAAFYNLDRYRKYDFAA